MKKNVVFAGMLVMVLIPTACSAGTAVKDTIAGSTWSGVYYGDPATFTFAKEGGTFEGIYEDDYVEGSYNVVTGIEITLESSEYALWLYMDEDSLVSVQGDAFSKISGKEGIANTKWGDDNATIEFSKDSLVATVGDESSKGTYKVAPFILLNSPYEYLSLVLIDGKLTFAKADDYFLTKETASPSINGVYELVSGDSYAKTIELKSGGICVVKYSVAGGFSFQGEYTVEGSDVVMNLQGMLVHFKKIGDSLFSEATTYEGFYQKH
jgi:hypothetical protein